MDWASSLYHAIAIANGGSYILAYEADRDSAAADLTSQTAFSSVQRLFAVLFNYLFHPLRFRILFASVKLLRFHLSLPLLETHQYPFLLKLTALDSY